MIMTVTEPVLGKWPGLRRKFARQKGIGVDGILAREAA
jgi:hypothetical protein